MTILFLILPFLISAETIIKVKIGETKTINVYSPAKFIITSGSGKEKILPSGTYKVKPFGQKVRIGKMKFEKNIILQSKRPISINKRKYRAHGKSKVIIINKGEKLLIINELPLEEYLYGVVPGEMPYTWHTEALKAQAVVARTYALRNFNKHRNNGYNLCNSPLCCQVYGGLSSERTKTNEVVDSTRDEVLTYNSYFIVTYYHSCCGGQTESSVDVWGGNILYLRSVVCGYCKDSPRYFWEKIIDESLIIKSLKRMKYNVKKITNIEIYKRANSGRAKNFIINGKIKVNAAALRMAISPFVLFSTKIVDIKKVNDDKYLFTGYGWGHGVGLCQWGSRGMAMEGKSYIEILDHYYPGTSLSKITEHMELNLNKKTE